MNTLKAIALAIVLGALTGCASAPPAYSEPTTVYRAGPDMHSGPVVVRSYVRKDGTYVRSHTRSR